MPMAVNKKTARLPFKSLSLSPVKSTVATKKSTATRKQSTVANKKATLTNENFHGETTAACKKSTVINRTFTVATKVSRGLPEKRPWLLARNPRLPEKVRVYIILLVKLANKKSTFARKKVRGCP